jgi:hypothetical protein
MYLDVLTELGAYVGVEGRGGWVSYRVRGLDGLPVVCIQQNDLLHLISTGRGRANKSVVYTYLL